MEIINLTPHALNINNVEGTVLLKTVPSAGMARVSEAVNPSGMIDGDTPVVQIVRDAASITGVPEPASGTVYVVSDMAFVPLRQAGRTDIYRPGVAVRDETGRIISCKGLSI